MKTVDGKSTIGNIVKKWTGLAREVATDASIFQIRFPMDLDINMKAVITGASFLMVSPSPKTLQYSEFWKQWVHESSKRNLRQINS